MLGSPWEMQTFSPVKASNSSLLRPPALSITISGVVRSMIVVSTPMAQGPPSRIISTLSPKLSATCRAVVGEMHLKRLAEGAAIGTPAALMSFKARG